MNTIAVGNFVGFEVTTIQDVVKAQACGLVITDKDGNEYTYDIEEEDENGEYFDREPTDKEVFDRIAQDIAHGNTLVAGFWLDTDKVQIVPRANLTLQTDFYIGQKVYTIRDNKVTKVVIKHVWLSRGEDSSLSSSKDITIDICSEFYNRCSSVAANFATKDYITKQIEKVRAMDESFAYVSDGNTSFLVKLSEVFATKGELVKHLMGE